MKFYQSYFLLFGDLFDVESDEEELDDDEELDEDELDDEEGLFRNFESQFLLTYLLRDLDEEEELELCLLFDFLLTLRLLDRVCLLFLSLLLLLLLEPFLGTL